MKFLQNDSKSKNIKTSDTCNVEKHLKNAMITPVWPYVGLGVILKILNFLGFPGNFIFCKTGPKVFAYFTGVLSHYWGIIIHQTKPDSSGYQKVKGFWDPSTYSWEKGYFTCLRNFGTHCMKMEGFFQLFSIFTHGIFWFGVILKILNFFGFPGNFIFCKTGP